MSDVFKCKSEKDFIPGLKLNKGFYIEVVKPMIEKAFPGLRYAAALIGHCSDVFGFDDYKSTDHVWGPRLQLFLEEKDYGSIKGQLDHLFKNNLPFEYKGFPTNYKAVEGWTNNGYMQRKENYPLNHFIEIDTVGAFFNRDIALSKDCTISFKDWLAFPVQHLFESVSGEVFYDGIGDLTQVRQVLSFFPEEVMLLRTFLLWKSINEEQAFMGRCWEKGDRVGESIITNRIINKLMKLCFYYKRKYYPYSKWFGLAFQRLETAPKALPYIEAAIASSKRNEREVALCEFYRMVVSMHNQSGLTDSVEPKMIDYYGRGYRGFDSELIIKELSSRINWSKIKDIELLSKIELFDDSYYGCTYEINKKIVEDSVIG